MPAQLLCSKASTRLQDTSVKHELVEAKAKLAANPDDLELQGKVIAAQQKAVGIASVRKRNWTGLYTARLQPITTILQKGRG